MTGNECTQETVFDQISTSSLKETAKNNRMSSSQTRSGQPGSPARRFETGDRIERLPESAALEDWIDGQEVMIRLHISQRTLQTLRSNGTVPFSRIGHKLYYLRQDIERILCDNYIMLKLRERYGNDI